MSEEAPYGLFGWSGGALSALRLLSSICLAIAAFTLPTGGYAETGARLRLQSAAVVECLTGGGAASQPADRPLRLSWNQLKPFDPAILGFNPSFRLSADAQGNFQHPDMLRFIDNFPVNALRYPPGTYASVYDWDSGTLDPRLAREYEIKSMLSTIESQRMRLGHLIRSNYRNFLALTVAHEITPFVVLNLYTRGINDAEQVVSRVSGMTTEPIRWELGNELSQPGYRGTRKNPWNVDVYVQRALVVAKAIRQNGEADQIGVDIAGLVRAHGYLQVPERVIEHSTAWNRRITDSIGSFDAVILHPYIRFVPQVIQAGMNERSVTGRCNGASTAGVRSAVAYQWVFSAAEEVPAEYKNYLAAQFPGKRVWLTEVGLAGSDDVSALEFGPSGILRTLFNISYFAHWVDAFPDLGAYMFHVLGMGKGSFSAIYPDGSFNSNSISYVFLRRLLDGATKVGVQTFDAGTGLRGVGPYRDDVIRSVIAIMTRTPATRRVLVANIGFSPVAVASPFAKARLTSIGGLPLVSLQQGRIRSFSDLHSIVSNAPALTLAPVSLTLIEDADVSSQ